jgi:hypothetical protein
MDRLALMGCAAAVLGFALHGGAAQQRAPAVLPPETTQAMPHGDVGHGRYIVHNVAMCVECHSGRDADGNIIPEQEFMGAPIPVRPSWGYDWAVRAPRNAGLPGYNDEQAMRLLTEGAIDRDGNQLNPPMPRFRMTRQDAADVIAYMRTLK